MIRRLLMPLLLASLALSIVPAGQAATADVKRFDSGHAAIGLLDGQLAAVAASIGRELTREFQRGPDAPGAQPSSNAAASASTTTAAPAPTTTAKATTTYVDSPQRRQQSYARFVQRVTALDAADGADLAARFKRIDLVALVQRQIVEQHELRADDVATAYATWWILAWEAAHLDRSDKPKQTVQHERDRVARVLLQMPEFLALDDAKRQELAEALLVQGALVNQTQRRHQQDKAASAAVASVVREAARIQGMDLDAMLLTLGGFFHPKAETLKTRGYVDKGAADRAPRNESTGVVSALASRLIGRLRIGSGCLIEPGTSSDRFSPFGAVSDPKALVGVYRCREEGLAVTLRLQADGRFVFDAKLSDPDGDESALRGLWRIDGRELVLSAEPSAPPALVLRRAVHDPAVAVSVAVTTPDGGPPDRLDIAVDLTRHDAPVGYLYDGMFRAAVGEKLYWGQEGADPPRSFRLVRSSDDRELLRMPLRPGQPNSFSYEYRPSPTEPFEDVRAIVIDPRAGTIAVPLGQGGALLKRSRR